MPSKKTFSLILIFFSFAEISFAQNSHYSQLFSGDLNNEYTIVGKIGNTYHICKISTAYNNKHKKTTIQILVFSYQMDLMREKLIDIIESELNASIYFNFFLADSSHYYALVRIIQLEPAISTSYIYKIDEEGNFSNITDQKDNVHLDAPVINTVLENNSIIVNPDSVIYRVIQKKQDLSQSTSEKNREEEMIVYKAYIRDTNWIAEARFKSTKFDFNTPKLLKDSSGFLWVYASRREQTENSRNETSRNYPFFLAKLDTNLNVISGSPKIIGPEVSGNTSKNHFVIEKMFSISGKLLIFSVDSYSTSFYNSSYSYSISGAHNAFYSEFGSYFTNRSFCISEVDSSTNVLKDTIIDLNPKLVGSQLSLENAFFQANQNFVDFFCAQKFGKKMNGVKHIQFGNNKYIRDTDLKVDPKNEYLLFRSAHVSRNVYIIPFMRHNKIGFMKTDTSNDFRN